MDQPIDTLFVLWQASGESAHCSDFTQNRAVGIQKLKYPVYYIYMYAPPIAKAIPYSRAKVNFPT